MRITIDIPDEMAAIAASRGMSPEGYAEQVVHESVSQQAERMKRVERFLKEFPISGLPSLSDDAYSRESIYSDED